MAVLLILAALGSLTNVSKAAVAAEPTAHRNRSVLPRNEAASGGAATAALLAVVAFFSYRYAAKPADRPVHKTHETGTRHVSE